MLIITQCLLQEDWQCFVCGHVKLRRVLSPVRWSAGILVPAGSLSSPPLPEVMLPWSPAWHGGPPQSPLPFRTPFPSPQGVLLGKMKPQTAQAWMRTFHCCGDTLLVGASSTRVRQQATRLLCLEAATPPYGICNVYAQYCLQLTCARHCQPKHGWGGLGDWDGASNPWHSGKSRKSLIWWPPSVTWSPSKLPPGTRPVFSVGNCFPCSALGEEALNRY